MRPIPHLSERQNHRCCYCGHRMVDVPKNQTWLPRNALTREHVIPKSYDGDGLDPNLVAACSLCNGLRGNIDATAFFYLQQEWFRHDRTLRERWHSISPTEYRHFRQQCLITHELHLRRRSKKCVIAALRYQHFLTHHGEQLQLRAC